jgi:hypothetical protein
MSSTTRKRADCNAMTKEMSTLSGSPAKGDLGGGWCQERDGVKNGNDDRNGAPKRPLA